MGSSNFFPHAVLGVFPQADSYLVPDYIQLIEQSKVEEAGSFFQSKSWNTYAQSQNEFYSMLKRR